MHDEAGIAFHIARIFKIVVNAMPVKSGRRKAEQINLIRLPDRAGCSWTQIRLGDGRDSSAGGAIDKCAAFRNAASACLFQLRGDFDEDQVS